MLSFGAHDFRSRLLLPLILCLFLLPSAAFADELSCLSGSYVCSWDPGQPWPEAYTAVSPVTLKGSTGVYNDPNVIQSSKEMTLYGGQPFTSTYNYFAIGVVKFDASASFSSGDYYVSTPPVLAFAHQVKVPSGVGRYYAFDVFTTATTEKNNADSYLCIKDSSGTWHKVFPSSGYFSVDYSFNEIYFYTHLPDGYSFSGMDGRFWGFTSLPKFFKVTQVTNQDIVNQTESLKDTTGSDSSFSDVVSSNSQSDFDTRLGAVSQVVDISGQLFTAVLNGSEGDGIPFSGYSVTLPVGGTLSVPSSTIDVWSMFPDAETPVRTALTLMLVIAWVHGVYRWYESLVSPGEES